MVSFGTISWIMPAADQAFVKKWRGRPSDRSRAEGYRRTDPLELHREMRVAAAQGAHEHRAAFRVDLSRTFGIVLCEPCARCSFLVTFSNGSILRGVFAFLVCLRYRALLYTGEFLGMHERAIPAFVAAWLPNIVFVSAAVLIASSRRSRLRGSAILDHDPRLVAPSARQAWCRRLSS